MKRLLDPPFDVFWAILAGPAIILALVTISNSAPLLTTYDGMLKFTVCSNTPDVAFDKEEIFIDPGFIVMITNPPETRKECVKIINSTGRGIHVYGTIESIASERRKALEIRR